MFSLSARYAARANCFNASRPLRFLSNTVSRRVAVPKVPLQPGKPTLSKPTTVEKSRSEKLQFLASRILAAGNDEIYRNSALGGYVAASLSIMALCYGCIGYIYSTKLWQPEVAKERGLNWKVPYVYQVTMMCWGGLAAYAFGRTLGLVKSIKLVKKGDQTLIQTTIRRPIPFLRAEQHVAEPHTLILNRGKFYGAMSYDNMIVASDGKSLGARITNALFYRPFHNTRKTLGGVGLVPIQIGPLGHQRHLILDTDGLFSNEGKDLLNLSRDEFE